MVKKRTKDWAIFTEGLRESADKREKRVCGNKKGIHAKEKETVEGGQKPVITVMQPEQICVLGRKLGVINNENEGVVLRRIR